MNLETKQAHKGGTMERFLDIHIYMTSLHERHSLTGALLQLALDAVYTKVILVYKPPVK